MADHSALYGYVLRAIATLLLVVQGTVHLRLWDGGYRGIDIIGPLFLAGGIGALGLAVAVLARPSWLVTAAGLALSAGQIFGLLLSSTVGLFGFRTTWTWSGDQGAAFWSELLAVIVLAGLLRWRTRSLRPRTAPRHPADPRSRRDGPSLGFDRQAVAERPTSCGPDAASSSRAHPERVEPL